MTDSKDRALNLRTGEPNDENVGREILRAFRQQTEDGCVLNIKVSFPVYNPQNAETFWLAAQTIIDPHTAEKIAQYLRNWPDKDGSFRTGQDYTQDISFTSCWLGAEDVPAKKMRITMPATSDKTQKMALTKLNHANASWLANYLQAYAEEECDKSMEAQAVAESSDPEVAAIEKRIRSYEQRIDELTEELGDAREALQRKLGVPTATGEIGELLE